MKSKGFTLVETLTAMMILSICLVTVLQLFSGGLRANRISEEYTVGIFHAKAKMEEYLLLSSFHEGSEEGYFPDGYRWKVKISFLEKTKNAISSSSLKECLIAVQVSWTSGEKLKTYEIQTVHLAEKIFSETERN